MEINLYSVAKHQGVNERESAGEINNSPLCSTRITVKVPNKLTFVQVEDPWAPDNETITDAEEGDTDRGTDTGVENTNSGRHEMSDYGSVQSHSLQYAPALDAPQENTPPIYSAENFDLDPFDRVITSHLVQHFQQGPGQWMDLFDTTAYFSAKVPVLAASRPLLKSAVCVSAKHLRHLYQTSAPLRNNFGLPMADEETWQYQSAKHYDQALGRLKTAINLETYVENPSDKEEMLAAVAILCTFELMDAPGSAWRAHLDALPLFNDNATSMSAQSTIIIPRTAIKGPIFWSLARQDLLCAFISETQTRLNLKDLRLWQNAGLATDEHGALLPCSHLSMADIHNSSGVEEDMKSNELTWILGKISNHLTAGDALAPEDFALPPGQWLPIGMNQEYLLHRWNMLMAELDNWRDTLPPSFNATARTRAWGLANSQRSLSLDTFEQIWFDLPLCAATMQSYHQANILLLANEPQESTDIWSTVSARLRSYRHALREVLHHAREICGISLANLGDSGRVNSVQALFAAGQVFQEPREQDALLEILFGIERDLGWTTKYHVARLTDEWARGSQDNHVGRIEQGDWP